MVRPPTRVRAVFNPVIRRVRASKNTIISARSGVIVSGAIDGGGTPRATLISTSRRWRELEWLWGKSWSM